MFPVRYFPKQYYAPTFFPPGDGDTPGVIYVTISDNVGSLSDVFKNHDSVRVLSDSVGITDSLSTAIILYRSVQDTVTSADGVSKTAQFRRILVDVLTPQDVVSRVYTGRRSLFDLAGYSDAVSKGQFRNIADSVSLTDFIRTGRIIRSSVFDNVGSVDVPDNIRDIASYIANVLSIHDIASADLTTIVRQLIDEVGITDSVNAGFLLTALLSESVDIHDSVLAFLRTTDIPCIVDLSVEGQGGIIESVMSGTPLIKTASGLLIPNISSSDAGDADLVDGDIVGTPKIIGRKEERDCNG